MLCADKGLRGSSGQDSRMHLCLSMCMYDSGGRRFHLCAKQVVARTRDTSRHDKTVSGVDSSEQGNSICRWPHQHQGWLCSLLFILINVFPHPCFSVVKQSEDKIFLCACVC